MNDLNNLILQGHKILSIKKGLTNECNQRS